MTLPSWRDWLFSAKAFLASMLALFIAFSFLFAFGLAGLAIRLVLGGNGPV